MLWHDPLLHERVQSEVSFDNSFTGEGQRTGRIVNASNSLSEGYDAMSFADRVIKCPAGVICLMSCGSEFGHQHLKDVPLVQRIARSV
jgi:hypothetical protein